KATTICRGARWMVSRLKATPQLFGGNRLQRPMPAIPGWLADQQALAFAREKDGGRCGRTPTASQARPCPVSGEGRRPSSADVRSEGSGAHTLCVGLTAAPNAGSTCQCRPERRIVWLSLLPIAIGHALAIGSAALLFGATGIGIACVSACRWVLPASQPARS